MKKAIVYFLLTVIIIGCLPLVLHVNKDGVILIPRQEGFLLYDPVKKTMLKLKSGEGEPVYGKFSPNGKDVLQVTKVKSGYNKFQVSIVSIANNTVRPLFSAENITYVSFSPDGNSIAVSHISKNANQKLGKALVQITVINIRDGKQQVVAKDLGALFRWYADSTHLLAFHVTKNFGDSNYHCDLVSINIKTKKQKPLVSAVTQTDVFFDISPDNTTVLFTAIKAANKGTQITEFPKYGDSKLYQLTLKTKLLKDCEQKAYFAIYSPNGKKVLLGVSPGELSFGGAKLMISDHKLQNKTTLVKLSHRPLVTKGGGVFPSWANNENVLYFTQKNTYGTEAKAIYLMSISLKEKRSQNLQPGIESALFNLK